MVAGTSPSSTGYSRSVGPVDIRIPNNAHPSRHSEVPNTMTSYGAVSTELSRTETTYFSALDDNDLARSPMSFRPRSFRETIGSLAESYSRTSVLYIAENLAVPASMSDRIYSHHGTSTSEPIADEECRPLALHRQEEDDSKPTEMQQTNLDLFLSGLDRTLSQRTAPPTTRSSNHLGFVPLSRHATIASVISQQLGLPDENEHSIELTMTSQKSSFTQSVFNAINVLIGVGILAFPLAFRYAGWLIGSFVFFFCALTTNYTAKLLVRCLDAAPGAMTYGDIGMVGFGERGRALIGTIFIVEVMTMSIAMVTLLGDGLQALYRLDLVTSRIICFVIMTPFEFFPLRRLSIASLIGIISCASLVIIVLFDGLTKHEKPGSLWDPMETELFPAADPSRIPLCFGLMMAGFAGHAVFPSIYRDMQDPKRYDTMVDITYVITIIVYAVLAAAGYLMFGLDTMQEITGNLAVTPGFYKALNQIALWLVVITPIAKFALVINPITLTCELWAQSRPTIDKWVRQTAWGSTTLKAVCRISLTVLVVYIAIVFPGFDRVMSLLGALFSFTISVILPILCYQRVFGRFLGWTRSGLHLVILAISFTMAVLGTVWSFLSAEDT